VKTYHNRRGRFCSAEWLFSIQIALCSMERFSLCAVDTGEADPSGSAVLRCGSAAFRLLGLWARIPPGSWMSVSCECCFLSVRGVCVRLITSPEEAYRVWCECDRLASIMRKTWPTRGCCAIRKKKIQAKVRSRMSAILVMQRSIQQSSKAPHTVPLPNEVYACYFVFFSRIMYNWLTITYCLQLRLYFS
jgi:hypothetical protein